MKINGFHILSLGDATKEEKKIINQYKLPQMDILKVGHHGSKTSTRNELLETIKPKYAFISIGVKNMYGHPNQDVLTH